MGSDCIEVMSEIHTIIREKSLRDSDEESGPVQKFLDQISGCVDESRPGDVVRVHIEDVEFVSAEAMGKLISLSRNAVNIHGVIIRMEDTSQEQPHDLLHRTRFVELFSAPHPIRTQKLA